MKNIKIIGFLSVLIFTFIFASGCSANIKSTEIINPVLPGDHPDPSVIKIGNTYWATATSNEWAPLFPIFKSDDLMNWELVTHVFPDGAPGWAVNNFWAPELEYDKEQGKVYIYYTARDKKSNRLSCAVASASNPSGIWKDHGPLVAQEAGSIDAFAVRDENNQLYLIWKEDGNSMGRPTPMWAQKMNDRRTKLFGEKHELFRNDTPWEQWLIEGICIFRHNDYFYATYSAGGCCDKGCNYKSGVARSKTLLGPWEKYSNNPVLVDNADWKCPGHGTVVKKGKDLYLLYHAYNSIGSVFVGREGLLQKIYWTEDGWPTFKNDVIYNRPSETIDIVDTFKTKLNSAWKWKVTQDIDYKTTSKGLLLKASKENNDIGTMLVQKTKTTEYQMYVTIDLKSSTKSAQGGLALIGAENNGFNAPVAAMGISACDGKVFVWETRNNQTISHASSSYDKTLKEIQLKIDVSKGHILTFFWNNNGNWEVFPLKIDAANLVPWGMGYRFGLVAKGDSPDIINFTEFVLVNLEREQN